MSMKVGIVGFGRIGREHAGWLSRGGGIAVRAVFDPTPQRSRLATEAGLETRQTLAQLLDDPAIDAVLIATPTSMHLDHATLALQAGKHVMVEKPLALDLAQSLQLAELARQQGRVLSVFHNRRWDRDYLTVAGHIAGGTFGRVLNVESRLGQWGSCVGPAAREYRPGWRNEASFGGGGLYDWGSHFVDQLWRMMLPRRPLRVYAQLRGNVWTRDCDDLARVCIDFDDGAVGLVEINTTSTRPLPRWHVDGTAGSADSPFSLAFDIDRWAEVTFSPADGGASRRLDLAEPGLDEVGIWERFTAAVRGEGEPAVSVQGVLPTMALLDAARHSSADGRAVDLAEWRELFVR